MLTPSMATQVTPGAAHPADAAAVGAVGAVGVVASGEQQPCSSSAFKPPCGCDICDTIIGWSDHGRFMNGIYMNGRIQSCWYSCQFIGIQKEKLHKRCALNWVAHHLPNGV